MTTTAPSRRTIPASAVPPAIPDQLAAVRRTIHREQASPPSRPAYGDPGLSCAGHRGRGLGEAGSAIARDLVRAGANVRGYDPAATAADDITGTASEAEAARGADLVLSVNSAKAAVDAVRNPCAACSTRAWPLRTPERWSGSSKAPAGTRCAGPRRWKRPRRWLPSSGYRRLWPMPAAPCTSAWPAPRLRRSQGAYAAASPLAPDPQVSTLISRYYRLDRTVRARRLRNDDGEQLRQPGDAQGRGPAV